MGANSRDRGRGIPHPHRGPSLCPRCGKKGLSNWSARAAAVLKRPISSRDCRYCSYGETWHHPSGGVTNTRGEVVVRPALTIRGKLGTHPSDLFYAKAGERGALVDLPTPPAKGDRVFVKSEGDQRCQNYTQVLVNEINDVNGPFFMMELG